MNTYTFACYDVAANCKYKVVDAIVDAETEEDALELVRRHVKREKYVLEKVVIK